MRISILGSILGSPYFGKLPYTNYLSPFKARSLQYGQTLTPEHKPRFPERM